MRGRSGADNRLHSPRAPPAKCARRAARAAGPPPAKQPRVTPPARLLLALALAGCGGVPPSSAAPPPALPSPPSPDDGGAPPASSVDLAPPALADASSPADLAHAPEDLARPLPTKKTLNFTWQGEELYYYCGPSSARMALSTRMTNLPSQQELGSYMGTTSNGTDDIGLVRGALDHYLNITAYLETDLPDDPPTAAQQAALKKALVASIDAGYGLVANVVSGWRPPGYPPNGTIYHYVALVGYDQGGDKVLIADPAATGCGDGLCGNPSSGFYNVPKSYWINTSDLGVWITPKGYTYHP